MLFSMKYFVTYDDECKTLTITRLWPYRLVIIILNYPCLFFIMLLLSVTIHSLCYNLFVYISFGKTRVIARVKSIVTRTYEWKWVMIASKKWEWYDPWEELDFSVRCRKQTKVWKKNSWGEHKLGCVC